MWPLREAAAAASVSTAPATLALASERGGLEFLKVEKLEDI